VLRHKDYPSSGLPSGKTEGGEGASGFLALDRLTRESAIQMPNTCCHSEELQNWEDGETQLHQQINERTNNKRKKLQNEIKRVPSARLEKRREGRPVANRIKLEHWKNEHHQ